MQLSLAAFGTQAAEHDEQALMPSGHICIELSPAAVAQTTIEPVLALSYGEAAMYKSIIAATCALVALTGCTNTTVQNPVDYVTYRDQPLVKQVEDGMTRQQVLALGGTPSTVVQRTVSPGTCNNYVLTHEGHQQVYHVSFNSDGRVVHKGFMTCEQREKNERAL